MRTPEHAAAPGGEPGAGAIVDDDTTSVSAGATFQLLPALSVEEFEALKADIAAHGVHHPIEVDEHGRILDGHHRHRACTELGIDPPLRVVSNLDTDQDKRSHALRMNLSRRHLTRDQKRQVIAASITADPDLSDREHARRLGCSPTTVGTVRKQIEVSKLDNPPSDAPLSAEQAEEFERLTAEIDQWLNDVRRWLNLSYSLLVRHGVPERSAWQLTDRVWADCGQAMLAPDDEHAAARFQTAGENLMELVRTTVTAGGAR